MLMYCIICILKAIEEEKVKKAKEVDEKEVTMAEGVGSDYSWVATFF